VCASEERRTSLFFHAKVKLIYHSRQNKLNAMGTKGKKKQKRWPRTEKETRPQLLLLLNFQFETYNSPESTFFFFFGARTTEVTLQRTKGGGGIELG